VKFYEDGKTSRGISIYIGLSKKGSKGFRIFGVLRSTYQMLTGQEKPHTNYVKFEWMWNIRTNWKHRNRLRDSQRREGERKEIKDYRPE